MPAPWTYDQGVELKNKGMISDKTFSTAYPEGAPVAEPAPPMAAPSPTPAEPAAAPMPAPEKKEDDFGAFVANAQRAKEFAQAQRASEERAATSQKAAELHDKIQQRTFDYVQAGFPEGEIRKILAPDMESLKTLKQRVEANDQQATAKNASFTTDATAKPNVVLASDTKPAGTDGQQIGQGGAAKAMNDLLAPSVSGFNLAEQGVRDAAAVAKTKAAEESAYLEKVRQDDEDRLKTLELRRVAEEAHVKAATDKLDQMSQDIASQKIDPRRFWNNKSNGEKILASIAIALGGLGKGDNTPLKIINGQIEDDITAQKVAIDSKKSGYEAQNGLYKDMLARFKDRRIADDATRVAYLENAQLQVRAFAAKYAGPEAEAKAKLLLGEIEQKKQEAKQRFVTNVLARMPVSPESNPELLTEDQRKRFVPGFGLALTEKDASDLKNDVAQARVSKDSINQLLKISEMSGKSVDPNLVAEASTIASTLRGSLRTFLVGPGAVTESEQKLLDDVIANPTKILSLDSSNQTRLKTLLSRVDTALNSKVKAFGMKNPTDKIGFQTAGK